MMRAYLNTMRCFSATTGLMALLWGFGIVNTSPSAHARSYHTPNMLQSPVFDQTQLGDSIVTAQKIKRKRRLNLRKKRRLNRRQLGRGVSSGKAASLGTVARRVRRRVPGQLLGAQLMKDRRGRLIYRLKILNRNGVMRNVTADAYTGAILGIR